MTLFFYRIGHWSYRRKIPIAPRVCTVLTQLIFGAHIPSSCSIGQGTKIAYGGSGLVVHARARIGKDCLLSPGVVIGGRAGQNGVPVVHDNVSIFPGAKILGAVEIGNGCQVGANAIVIASLPEHSVVVAPLGRLLPRSQKDDSGMTQ
ncbi:serine O-acetyltransferase [Arthrobacter halodurans]|uniref:Serine acetyltransferase n=1 Tax=Arthrobacter halodurans TaxID=516699 RepID=A0ABV4UK41_9MICC